MDFRIQDLTIHLSDANQGPPCTMLSGNPNPCTNEDPCKGKSVKPPKPDPGGGKPGGGKKRHLAMLRAQLRETLAPPPV